MPEAGKLQEIEIVFKNTVAFPSRATVTYLVDEQTLAAMATNFSQYPHAAFRYNAQTPEGKPRVLFLAFDNVLYIG